MVSDLKTFAHKESKLAAAKKVFYRFFLHLFTPFKRLSAPTSQSPMSKLFRFLESLGKSNGKKWSQIWKLLLIKGVKLPRIKEFVFSANFALLAVFFWYRCYCPHWSSDSLSPVCGIFCSIIVQCTLASKKKHNLAQFCCVFLILKAGIKSSPINSSEQRKFPRATSHEQDQKYNFLILGPFKCSFCKYT